MTTLSETTPQTPDTATRVPQARLVLTADGTLRMEHPEHYQGEDLFHPTEAQPPPAHPASDWETFLNLWWDTRQSQPVPLKTLLAIAQDHHLFVARRANGNHRSQKIRLGIFLHRHKGLLLHGFRLISLANPHRRKSETRFVLIQDSACLLHPEGG